MGDHDHSDHPSKGPPGCEPNWANRTLFHGDNLTFLRAMNSETVSLIATDPPFNKGRDFHATPGSMAAGAKFQDRWSWERDVHQDWIDQITDDHPRLMGAIDMARYAYSDSMGAFLCFMAVRLLELRRILKPTGSIYLHCDPTASHYLKMVMDAVFGWRNFRNEIIWCYTQGGRPKRDFPRKHETIFRYTKTDDYLFNRKDISIPYEMLSAKSSDSFTKQDDQGRWYKEIKGTGSNKQYRYYKDEGKAPYSWWVDIPQVTGRAAAAANSEHTGYPTQKPIALYERIIRASSNKEDIVLDPFCGCATTLVAAERLDRQWVGIDIWDSAHGIVVERLMREAWAEGAMESPDKTGSRQTILSYEDIQVTYSKNIPERTDSGEQAAPFLRVKEKVREPAGQKMSRSEMYEFLLTQHGSKCQGCDRSFDDSRYLELDHNTPRSDGGLNHLSNRILLCGPCNRLKSNQYTLSGLRRENKKRHYMA